MISIITAYFNRKELFINTLKSIQAQNFRGDFEVIAVDDGSDQHQRLEDLVETYPFLKVIYLDPSKKWYKNSCIPFNVGFSEAKGDKIIIQNPECLHLDNILQYTQDQLTNNKYFSFSCFSLDKNSTEKLSITSDYKSSCKKLIAKNDFTVKRDGDLGWYNHSIHRPVYYHFCCCIMKEDLYDLGGFDERYALGVGVDDDEFVYRIRQKGMSIKIEDNISVLHQNHYLQAFETNQLIELKKTLYFRNKNIFKHVTQNEKRWRVNYLGEFKNVNNSVLKNFSPNLLSEIKKQRKDLMRLEGYESSRIIKLLKNIGFLKGL